MGSYSQKTLKKIGGGPGASGELDRPGRAFTRRAFLRRLGIATAAAVTLTYVKPSLLTMAVPKAYATGQYEVPTPTPRPPCAGLTPGYWKNWRNRYTADQFRDLLGGTFVRDIPPADTILEIADTVMEDYRARPGEEMTILRVFMLAVQLTIGLMSSGLPIPAGVSLSGSCELSDGTTLSSAIADGLTLESRYPYPIPGVVSSDRTLALNIKDRLAQLLTV